MYYTGKNAQVVTNLQQTCSNVVPTTCQQDVFALLVDNGLLTTCYKVDCNNSTDLLQVVPTTYYRLATQQFVNNCCEIFTCKPEQGKLKTLLEKNGVF
jgi:hypothetical protein